MQNEYTPQQKLLNLVLCVASMIFNDSTKSSRHGMNKLANILPDLSFSILQELPLLEIGCWMESDAQLVSSEFPIGVRLGSDQETYLATESLSPCSSSEIQQ